MIYLGNYKVIGIHKRYHKYKNLNLGSFIKYMLFHIQNNNLLYVIMILKNMMK